MEIPIKLLKAKRARWGWHKWPMNPEGTFPDRVTAWNEQAARDSQAYAGYLREHRAEIERFERIELKPPFATAADLMFVCELKPHRQKRLRKRADHLRALDKAEEADKRRSAYRRRKNRTKASIL